MGIIEQLSESEREKFLLNQIFSLTLQATVQRSSIYQKNATPKGKGDFRRGLERALKRLAKGYEGTVVSDATHCKNIEGLTEELTTEHANVLVGGRFRIGSAQKALNLYLKYMWCSERISLPPHCPIDAQVLAELKGCEKIRWTRLDSITKYAEIIGRAKAVAGESSLAEWELCLWNTALAAP